MLSLAIAACSARQPHWYQQQQRRQQTMPRVWPPHACHTPGSWSIWTWDVSRRWVMWWRWPGSATSPVSSVAFAWWSGSLRRARHQHVWLWADLAGCRPECCKVHVVSGSPLVVSLSCFGIDVHALCILQPARCNAWWDVPATRPVDPQDHKGTPALAHLQLAVHK